MILLEARQAGNPSIFTTCRERGESSGRVAPGKEHEPRRSKLVIYDGKFLKNPHHILFDA